MPAFGSKAPQRVKAAKKRFELHRLPILFIFLNYLSILFSFAFLAPSPIRTKTFEVSEEIISRSEERGKVKRKIRRREIKEN